MPHYKLYYFDGRGRGELARLIFAAAGQTFDDVRYSREEWPSHKGEFHFGQLPVLEVDGEKIPQSAAIFHYLGTTLGLAGKTPLDAFKCHALAEAIRDLMDPVGKIMFYEKDEERKKKMREEFETVTLKNALEKLESYLKNAGGDYLVAGQLTYADIALYYGFFSVGGFLGRDVLADHPLLSKHSHAVAAQPKIATYLANRKQTQF